MATLFTVQTTIDLPERVAVEGRLGGNAVRRLASPKMQMKVAATEEAHKGRRFIRCEGEGGFSFAIVDRATQSLHGCAAVVKVDDISSIDKAKAQLAAGNGQWLLPRSRRPGTLPESDAKRESAAIPNSWRGSFRLIPEEYDGDRLVQAGLRPPQVGAINAAKAHWSVTSQTATLVLPTGSGKTDTMVALLVSERIERLMVIVPTDALRRQIGEKFVKLGLLAAFGCIAPVLAHPAVAFLSHKPKTKEEIDALVAEANVIVSTMQVLSGLSPALQEHLASRMTHLFVDEAHHIGAKTWREFKYLFNAKKVLQFTATPYRHDERRLDGRFIYVYPLRRAQEEKLFTEIKYLPVHGTSESDTDSKIIAQVAKQLSEDLARGFSHLVMARTSSKNRAEALHALYTKRLGKYKPQLIHSGMTLAKRTEALNELRSGRSKIIVCVNMLGEGFDLPDLKIAALHDKHKSEAVTLQFVGRFTRSRSDLGTATVIANVTIDDANASLKALYAEDADWNHVLEVIGKTKTERERRREDLFTGFVHAPETIPLETLEPRFNCIVYRTKCAEWKPDDAELVSSRHTTIIEGPVINREHRLVIFVQRDEERVRWTSIRSTMNVELSLIMAHWDPDLGLLFINSSKLNDLHEDLAQRLAGPDVERVTGETVFRVLYGFRRLVLMNLGLSETQRKPVRYSQFMGSDIADPLDTLAGNRSRTKTNLFGQGYVDVEEFDESGAVVAVHPSRETIGCSRKGKIWSYHSSNSFIEWIDWCRGLGKRLMNDAITEESILKNIVRPKKVPEVPPDKVPVAVAWPERFLYDFEEDRIYLKFGDGEPVAFFNCEIELLAFKPNKVIPFRVTDGTSEAVYELEVTAAGADYRQIKGKSVTVQRGRKDVPLIDVFREDPPHIYFGDGDMLVASELFELRRDADFKPYDPAKIVVHDWKGIDLAKESQGVAKDKDSIQRYVIKQLLSASPPYDVIFDDDGAGEIADVVAIRRSGRTLKVDLFHCKYAAGGTVGARVEDLYEVCGQAQKSIRWAERVDEMLKHMKRRENQRTERLQPTRFERGTMATLNGLIGNWRDIRPEFSVTIVQPGYSQARAVRPHLELFAATESYLMETWRIPFAVWANG